MTDSSKINVGEKRFRLFGIATATMVFLVILAGGIVRATGSGMGCPGWPKCFDLIIPPTSESQLPPDYQTKFQVAGKPIAPFNVYKTWTEFINRLLGALLGVVAIGMFISSFTYRKNNKIIIFLSGLIVILIAFEGWLGAKVVTTHLSESMISIHMIVALIITFLVIYTIFWFRLPIYITDSNNLNSIFFKKLLYIHITLLISLTIQVVLGIQIRELIDIVSEHTNVGNRETWLSQTGNIYLIHRSASWILVILVVYSYYVISNKFDYLKKLNKILLIFLVLEIVSGISLAYAGFPIFAQPLHLLVGSLIVSVEFLIVILILKQLSFLKINKVTFSL